MYFNYSYYLLLQMYMQSDDLPGYIAYLHVFFKQDRNCFKYIFAMWNKPRDLRLHSKFGLLITSW